MIIFCQKICSKIHCLGKNVAYSTMVLHRALQMERLVKTEVFINLMVRVFGYIYIYIKKKEQDIFYSNLESIFLVFKLKLKTGKFFLIKNKVFNMYKQNEINFSISILVFNFYSYHKNK